MKSRLMVLFLLSAIFVGNQDVFAVPSFLNEFGQTYPAAAGTKLNTCSLCHTSVPNLNPYGSDFRGANDDFAAIEGRDSDGDGATNIQEIQAPSFPGDANDRPAAPGPAPTPTPTPQPAPQPGAPGVIDQDDFSDATAQGDPNWQKVSGHWFLDANRQALSSASRGTSIAVFDGSPQLNEFEAGEVQADVSLAGRGSKANIVFGFKDARHYRFVRVEGQRILVGQVGTMGGEKAVVKSVHTATVPLNTFHTIRVSIGADGLVTVDTGGLTPPISVSFSASAAGRVGFVASNKVFFDNFQASR